ncbi:MAG: hypothetical protein ACTS4U_00880 [Candidatus Hodgkinia cicadicola]
MNFTCSPPKLLTPERLAKVSINERSSLFPAKLRTISFRTSLAAQSSFRLSSEGLLSEADAIERMTAAQRQLLNTFRSALTKGGIIFTDVQSFQPLRLNEF